MYNMISQSEFEETIKEYNDNYYEMDKAIAARDKMIDNLKYKVTDYRERFYSEQHDNDDLKFELEKENKNSDKLIKDLNDLKAHLKDTNSKIKSKDEAMADIVDKYTTDKAVADEKLENDKKELLIAKNVINELKEKVEEKDIMISNMQLSQHLSSKSTMTQTSLAEQLKEASSEKFKAEKEKLMEKFKVLHSQIDLQIVNLCESVKRLKKKQNDVRCTYGWSCTRRFCKYNHEYLHTFSAKCDNTINVEEILKKHTKNTHESNGTTSKGKKKIKNKRRKEGNQKSQDNIHIMNVKKESFVTNGCAKDVEIVEAIEKEESESGEEHSSTPYNSSISSILESSPNSSCTIPESAEEKGGMSESNY